MTPIPIPVFAPEVNPESTTAGCVEFADCVGVDSEEKVLEAVVAVAIVAVAVVDEDTADEDAAVMLNTLLLREGVVLPGSYIINQKLVFVMS